MNIPVSHPANHRLAINGTNGLTFRKSTAGLPGTLMQSSKL